VVAVAADAAAFVSEVEAADAEFALFVADVDDALALDAELLAMVVASATWAVARAT
jgi:hypothetical protein